MSRGRAYRGLKPATPEGKAQSARHIKSGRKVQMVMKKAYELQTRVDEQHAKEHLKSLKDGKKKLKAIKKMLKGKYSSSRSVGS